MNTHLTHLCSETRLPQAQELLRIHEETPYEGLPVCGNIEVNPLDDGGDYWADGVMSEEVPAHAVMLGDFKELITSFGQRGWLKKWFQMRRHAKTVVKLDRLIRHRLQAMVQASQMASAVAAAAATAPAAAQATVPQQPHKPQQPYQQQQNLHYLMHEQHFSSDQFPGLHE